MNGWRSNYMVNYMAIICEKKKKILNKILEDFERSDPKNIIAMKKNNYQKPEMNVVLLQHQAHLLSGSIQTLNTNLDTEDELEFTGDGWGGSGR